MPDGERPRRPGKVILLVVVLWIVGGGLQTTIGALAARSGLVDEASASLVGLVIGWGLLIVIFYYYRREIEAWLRR